MIEKEVVIENELYGTWTQPEKNGSQTAILLVAGSGPVDRNGNGPKGKFQTNLYKDLAHFFTDIGFMTFRYDKRGTGKRSGSWMDAGLFDLIHDARQAAAFSKAQPHVSRLIVCGHSEGTIIATELAASGDVDGCMLLSGGVDNLMEALHHQRQQAYRELFALPSWKGWVNRKLKIDEKNEKKTEKMMQKMKTSRADIVRIGGLKQPAKWFREHDAYDTRAALRQVACPVFALHGDKDPLVESSVLTELEELVQGKSEFHIVPDMEHGLRVQTEPKSLLNMKKLMKITAGRPLHKTGCQKMSGWLASFGQ
ncbi:alpha/beta hydrolase [Domibacillus robiginosus]|uniref:alpha/beta hydrolase n=1 Tax=Domibacillus robiginosus TaxID=1071054 RepID=UPI00067A931D|nr:alpha/beta hydrolase [Domibacillus robiginosus]